MSTVPYQYVILRLVPRVERGEFINVGVVIHSQRAGFLDGAFHLDEQRARALEPDLDLAAVREALDSICRTARGDTPHGLARWDRPGQRFGWLAAPRSTMVQPGPVHGGVTDDPAAALRHLLATQVLR